MSDFTRRDFVKKATAVTAITATTLPGWAIQEKRDPLKIGLIGCGGRGTGAANQSLTANKDAVIWAVGDAFQDRLTSSVETLKGEQGNRAEVPMERRFVGFNAFQQVIDSGVDMVILTTPPHFRPAHLAAAVKAKKHVFCEKPMAVDGTGVRSVIESAKLANAHDFIVGSQDGYETIVGDAGVKLSGGQKQRIAIARAMLRKPRIMVLDEATSSLDNISEKKVQDAINQISKHTTVLIIAHRLSTIINADKILVLSNGNIVEEGTHQELLKINDVYSKLYNLQLENN